MMGLFGGGLGSIISSSPLGGILGGGGGGTSMGGNIGGSTGNTSNAGNTTKTDTTNTDRRQVVNSSGLGISSDSSTITINYGSGSVIGDATKGETTNDKLTTGLYAGPTSSATGGTSSGISKQTLLIVGGMLAMALYLGVHK